MNFKTKNIVFLICLLAITASCSIDDIEPVNQITEENVITNEFTANIALNRIYNSHRSSNIVTQVAAMGYYGIAQNRVRGISRDTGFKENDVQADSEILERLYTSLYSIINNVNFFIELIEAGNAVDLSDDRKNEMLAEARYFRAASHFRLLKVFGEFYNTNSSLGVVVNTKPVRRADPKARSSVQQTYNAIIADLEYATTNAGEDKEGHYFISAVTAQALLAKVQLYMGDFVNGASNALAVINNTDGYALEPVYADIFSKRWESSEVLFAPYVSGTQETFTTAASRFNSSRVARPTQLFKDIADASDGSLDAVNSSSGILPISGYDSRFLYTYSSATRGRNRNGKYPYISTTSDRTIVSGNTFYYLRMAEVYLIYAEAETRRTGGNLDLALQKLNDVRDRAGVPDKVLTNSEALLEDIRKEKMIELCSENAETYYDLIRYHSLGEIDITSIKSTLTSNKFILPIPEAALAGNNLLIPNP